MFTSENNWYKWQYGNQLPFGCQTGNLEFTTSFGQHTESIGTFKQELLKAARSVMDYSNQAPTILYSGGVDSEIMLRAFVDIGSNPDVVIVRYENDYNIYDVSYAVVTCEMLNVPYKIIDFSLAQFYENHALEYAELAQIDRPRALPYCKLLEMVDGFPVMGASDLTLIRTHDDYSQPGTWMIRCWEHDIGWSKFLRKINKPGVAEWFKWTPGLVLSYMKTSWVDNLINDRYYGKLGNNSTKILGYREAYPDLISRTKKTGFENIEFLVNEVEHQISKKFNGLPYRNFHDRTTQGLINEITASQ
jgi:hypothetical protein